MNTVESVTKILNKHDPEGLIRLGCPEDEYNPEAKLILELMSQNQSTSTEELAKEVHRIFEQMFDKESVDRREEVFYKIATELIEDKGHA